MPAELADLEAKGKIAIACGKDLRHEHAHGPSIQNAVIGPDNSLSGGIIGATTILILNYLVVRIAYRSPKMRHILEPSPTLLIHDGRVLHTNLKKELITMDDLDAALRKNGILDYQLVQVAVLEENGNISVIPKTT